MQPNPINIPVAGNEMMTVVLTKILLNPSFLHHQKLNRSKNQ